MERYESLFAQLKGAKKAHSFLSSRSVIRALSSH